MKRIIVFSILLFLMFNVLSYAQPQSSIRSTIREINREGILLPSLEYASTLYDDFFYIDSALAVNETFNKGGWKFVPDSSKPTGGGASPSQGSFIILDTLGGVLQFTNPDSEDCGFICQWSREMWVFDTTTAIYDTGAGAGIVENTSGGRSKILRFSFKVMTYENLQSDMYIGFTETDTVALVYDSSLICDSLNAKERGIYFYKKDGDSGIYAITFSGLDSMDTTRLDSIYIVQNDSSFDLYTIEWNSRGRIDYYFNGALAASHTNLNYIPVGVYMTPTVAVYNGSSTKVLWYWDYFAVEQERILDPEPGRLR